jgi:hypothetical protein
MMSIISRHCQHLRVHGDLRLLIGTRAQKRPHWMVGLTPAQKRMVIASGPNDITGEEGHGVEIRGADYRVARALELYGLGSYSHGSPYGDLYFNNAEGLRVREMLEEASPGKDNHA